MKPLPDSSLAPFPLEALEWSDDVLGKFFLGYFMMAEAEARGVQFQTALDIPGDVAESIRLAVLDADAQRVEDLAIEKALRLAALGKSEQAGELVRKYFVNAAGVLKARNDALEWARSRETRRVAAEQSAEERRTKAESLTKQILDLANYFRQQGRGEHELAGLIAPRVRRTAGTVRKHLKLRKKRARARS